ncbi:AEC family transporter [Aureimonas fodinaquatilis]|uniref:AEC family transporter n=1 Tax=Aureimonas fodinaquatilis TaxID=2565783 RepID=A0A5B0E0L6_9HYPH|nr:AEC family transporter [Aureimonas fodinaquatilis]KAA0971655.1 AEC family transporter [Aureimonas fodinaquatilis]
MNVIISTILPIFGLIAIGYLSGKFRLLPAGTAEGLAAFVFTIAVPSVLFRTMATIQFSDENPVKLWLTYFAGIVIVFALGMLAARRFSRADRRTCVIAGVAASFSNMVMVGIPTINLTYGQEGMNLLAPLLAIHLPVMMIFSTLLIERAKVLDLHDLGEDVPPVAVMQVVSSVCVNLLRSPLILGILAGMAFRLSSLSFSGPLAEMVTLMATAAGPVTLFSLGLTLTRFSIRGDITITAMMCVLALMVQPAIVYAIGYFTLPPLWRTIAVLLAACPSGANAYLFATYFKSGQAIAATAIVMTTTLSALTLSFWVLYLG